MNFEEDIEKDDINNAKEFLEKFGFKKKLEDIISKNSNAGIIPILTANIGIFGVSATIFFAVPREDMLTAPVIVISIAAILSLQSLLLNLWYFFRIETRTSLFKLEQEKIFEKAEKNIAKTFALIRNILKFALGTIKETVLKDDKSKKKELLELKDKLIKNNDGGLNFLAEGSVFISSIIMDLALKETKNNLEKSFDTPLEEKNAKLKLIIDNFSDVTRNWGLILSATCMLIAILIKFIVN